MDTVVATYATDSPTMMPIIQRVWLMLDFSNLSSASAIVVWVSARPASEWAST